MDSLRNIMRSNTNYVVYGVALIVLATVGWVSGASTTWTLSSAIPREDSFKMPTWSPVSFAEKRAQAIEQANFEIDPDELAAIAAKAAERDAAKAQEPALPDYAWRFIGTAKLGDDTVVFINATQPKRFLTLSPVDPLPNGEKILEISADKLSYSDESGRHDLKLFDKVMLPNKDRK